MKLGDITFCKSAEFCDLRQMSFVKDQHIQIQTTQ